MFTPWKLSARRLSAGREAPPSMRNGAVHRYRLLVALGLLSAACATATGHHVAVTPHCDRAYADSVIAVLDGRGDTLGAPGVVPPRIIHHAPIYYPMAAHDMGRSGTVDYDFVVDTNGRVAPCTIRATRATDSLFIESGVDVLRQTTFAPARHGGVPVAVVARQTLSWSLR